MVYLLLADGFEEIETIGTIDILRRCGLQVQTLSVTGKRVVNGAHGLIVKADSLFRKNHIVHCDALVLPGGSKGAETMYKNSILRLTISQQAHEGTLVAAICAAPMVLGAAGVLKGKHATIYPGLEQYIDGAIVHREALVVEHDNIITAAGPAATRLFAFAVARRLASNPSVVDQVERDMLYAGFDSSVNQVIKFNG
uniref:DJ-1 family glyoxalase III n=1 Tax=Alloprevotella sp. TaxID=1872471 RepID=UPI0015A817AE